MIVRKTTEKDVELLVQLRVDFLMDQNPEKILENKNQLIDNLYSYFEKAIMRNEFIAVVAEEDGRAVSTAFMSIAERPPRPGNSSNRVGTIYSVYTYPEYRRKGIATKVLQLLLQEAKENNVATVDLSATADGRPLYEKLGFKMPKYTYMKLNLDEKKQNRIRPMKEAEIPICVDLIRRSFQTVADEFGFTVENAPRFTAFATTMERLTWQYEQKRPMFVYESEEGKIVGYYSLHLQENGECELNNLCVDSEYRHRKIGEKLFEHAVDVAQKKGCTVMNIGIVEENQKLRKWYEMLGAEHVGTKKFDFFPFTCGYLKKNIDMECV